LFIKQKIRGDRRRTVKIKSFKISFLIVVTFLFYSIVISTAVLSQPEQITDSQDREEVIINVIATRYEFTPNRLSVPEGANVTLVLTAEDRIHGFWLEGYNIEQTMCNEHVFTLNFIADKIGSFIYRCSEPACGPYHPYMAGIIHVEEKVNLILPVIVLPAGLFVAFITFQKYRKK
jgi:heme/copper-type cytochrome/quinol oxidase subunit 2